MAYVRFRTLIDENGDRQLEAQWLTDAEFASEYGEYRGDEPRELNVFPIDLTDEEVEQRNNTAAAFWDNTYNDLVVVGSPELY